MMSLSYAQVEALVTIMLGIHPDWTSAITARFMTIRRLGFPDGVNVGSAGRFRYDLDATMKCLLVFKLIDSLLMPQQAVSLLRQNWFAVGRSVRDIVDGLTFDGPELILESRPRNAPYLVLETDAFSQLRWPREHTADGATPRDFRPNYPGDLGLRPITFMVSNLTLIPPITARQLKPGLLAIDLFEVVAWTVASCVRAGWTTPEELGCKVTRTGEP